jgi:orotidine-5'-phosphate decarboxylase
MKDYFGVPRSHIILAADKPTYEENCRVVEQVHDKIDVIKISTALVLQESPRVVKRLQDRFGLPVFADMKIADVPHTCCAIVGVMKEAGANAVMVHGFVGPDAIQDCIEEADGKLGVIVQLELTHPGGLLFTQPIAEDMASAAASLDIFGVQAPGNRPQRVSAIRSIVGDDVAVVCCGVGAQGGKYGEVLAAGGDYAIIGRAIYNADDPAAAVEDILAGK